MKNIVRIAVLLSCTTGAAQAAASIKDLGMPLGQKLGAPVALCASQGPAANAGAPCWTEQPSVVDGVQTGSLSVPASRHAQEWAAPGTYGAVIGKDGVLQAVTVHSARADEYAQITSALAKRFGKPPTSSFAAGARPSAYWKLNDIAVQVVCGIEFGCKTRFALDDKEAREARLLQGAINWNMRAR